MKTQDVCKQKERVSQWGAGEEKDCRYKREKGCFMGLGDRRHLEKSPWRGGKGHLRQQVTPGFRENGEQERGRK